MRLSLTSVTGVLKGWYRVEAAASVDWDRLLITKEAIPSTKGWSFLTLHSSRPLFRDERESLGEYRYQYLLRESGLHFVIATSRNELVEHLSKKLSQFAPLASPAIAVPELVSDLIEQPDRYALGGVFAKIAGYARSIQSLSIYGSDLASARLFIELLPKLRPYRVQLRDTHSGQVVMAIGNKGELSFTYRGVQSLRSIDRALAFLSDKYTRWPGGR
jgi:hypothetical protein